MCKPCDEGKPQDNTASLYGSRRDFLKASTATAVAAAGMNFLSASPATAQPGLGPPEDSGAPRRRYVIRGGYVMSMDPAVGDFAPGDVLVQGTKILAVGPNLKPGHGAGVIDATGRIVMPGFIDTHHHQFETALRSFLANGILINDGSGSPSANPTYYEYILLTFAPVYRPQDVYISELFGGLAQLDDGVTTVHDISQIHHSPAHSDAAIQALFDTGRRAAFGYFESASGVAGNQYPSDAFRIKKQWFSSNDQLVHMIMGGEVYLGELTCTQAWHIGRHLGLQIAAHILSPDPPDPGRSRRRHWWRQQQHRARTRQPVHPHDGDVRQRLAGGQGQRSAGLDRLPDRDEHATRHSAHPQDAKPGHGAVPELGCRGHDDGGLLYPDALRDDHAAHGREPDDPRARNIHTT